MIKRISHSLIPILFIVILTSAGLATAQQAVVSTTYLPLVTLNRNRWIGPFGGYITSTVIDPTDQQTVYAGTWGSGVFKSQDGGQTWRGINRGLENLYVNSMAIDPTTSGVLYAGTYKSQVYKSMDGGSTWAWIGTGMQPEAVVYAIAVDPLAPATIYAGTRGISNNGNPPWKGVLYRSVDGGNSWFPILTDVGGIDAQDWVYSIAINPTENNSIYIATHEHGPLRSNDYGATWFAVHDGISDDSGRAIIISPDTLETTTLYYGVWHFDSVYKSVDGGNDWFRANRDIPYTKIYGMALDPLHPERVYLATFNRGVMKTLDGGESWQAAGLQDDRIYHVAIDASPSGTLYAGTAGVGLLRSPDGGATWQDANVGIQNSMATKVIISPMNPKKVYASVYGAGVYRSADQGSSWAGMNAGLTDKFVHTLVQDPVHPERLYALTDTGGLFQDNLNSGTGWVSIGQGLPITITHQHAYPADHPFASFDAIEEAAYPTDIQDAVTAVSSPLLSMTFAPSEPEIAYLGTGGAGIYKSTDGGIHWQAAGLSGETIQSLAVNPMDSQEVYAATLTAGSIKMSSDGGGTWQQVELAVSFYCLTFSQSAPGILYAGTDDGVYAYQSGEWTQTGLEGLTIISIAIDPAHPERIFAGTTAGAFFSVDSGTTWKTFDQNLSGLTIQSIDQDPGQAGWIYLSTTTHGIFQAAVGK